MRSTPASPSFATMKAAVSTQAQPDDLLMPLIARHDRNAMQTLFRRHNVRVYRFIVRLVNDESIAEDLTSEVFLDVWRQAGRFEGRSQVSTWLLAIARNKALSALRRAEPETPNDEEVELVEDPAVSPEAALQGKQRTDLVRNALTHLVPAQRQVIDLVYYHEKSVAEVAEILDIPQNTVKTRMFHARKRMAGLVESPFLDASRT